MARKKIEKEQTLEELIPLYGEQNTQCNALKKVVADLNSKIKAAIHTKKSENKDIEVDGWKCKLSVEESSNMNEERLLEFLKAHNIKGIIKTKEYVDFDALEKVIYAGDISKELLLEMNSCKDSNTKEVLRVTKLKEG